MVIGGRQEGFFGDAVGGRYAAVAMRGDSYDVAPATRGSECGGAVATVGPWLRRAMTRSNGGYRGPVTTAGNEYRWPAATAGSRRQREQSRRQRQTPLRPRVGHTKPLPLGVALRAASRLSHHHRQLAA